MTPPEITFELPSAHDLDFLRTALHREPVGVCGIAARDRAGCPAVIVNHPLQGGAGARMSPSANCPQGKAGAAVADGDIRAPVLSIPQPTTFWLVEAQLSARLATLEFGGAVKAVEAWLLADPERLARYNQEHRLYAAFRWSLLSDGEKAQLVGKPQEKVLRESGIGGMGETEKPAVKCLHLQAGWWLAYPKAVIGEWLRGRGIGL